MKESIREDNRKQSNAIKTLAVIFIASNYCGSIVLMLVADSVGSAGKCIT